MMSWGKNALCFSWCSVVNEDHCTNALVNTTVWYGSIIMLFALQVVPTMYSDVRNKTIHSNQYSVTEHFKRAEIQQGQNMPGVFFFYDLSPIKVTS